MPRAARIGLKTVKHLAWLSRIDLGEKDAREIAGQLDKILEYFSTIDEVDVNGVAPTYHVLDLQNVARSDEPSPFPSDEILKAAPNKKGRYIRAPRMA